MCTKSELQTVLRDVKTVSEQLYGTMLNRIILYGSYARGDNTDESELEQGVFLSILLRDRKHFEENLDFLPFYQNIIKEGITIYGAQYSVYSRNAT